MKYLLLPFKLFRLLFTRPGLVLLLVAALGLTVYTVMSPRLFEGITGAVTRVTGFETVAEHYARGQREATQRVDELETENRQLRGEKSALEERVALSRGGLDGPIVRYGDAEVSMRKAVEIAAGVIENRQSYLLSRKISSIYAIGLPFTGLPVLVGEVRFEAGEYCYIAMELGRLRRAIGSPETGASKRACAARVPEAAEVWKRIQRHPLHFPSVFNAQYGDVKSLSSSLRYRGLLKQGSSFVDGHANQETDR